ncbi:MAG: DUF424 family protein, partial [Candidatus Freyarchaeota archaeon]
MSKESFKMRVYLHIRRVNNEIMVAVCDEEILGKTFREGKLKIEVKKE